MISDVRFALASPYDQSRGLLGWVSLTVSRTLRIDGVVVRRTLTDALRLSFPSRLDSSGRRHFVVRPLSDRARRKIERQVFRSLGLLEVDVR